MAWQQNRYAAIIAAIFHAKYERGRREELEARIGAGPSAAGRCGMVSL